MIMTQLKHDLRQDQAFLALFLTRNPFALFDSRNLLGECRRKRMRVRGR